jgi:plastocyanin
MRLLAIPRAAALSAALVLSSSGALAHAQSGPQPLVIGVDHADPANQRPDQGRVFDYTDFFAREATVHTGDTVDFRFAPASVHVITLASSEQGARAAYPVGFADPDNRLATGTGFATIQLGPANGPIMGGVVVGGPNDPPQCGLTALGEKPCSFSGGNDVESSGTIVAVDPQSEAPIQVDWMVQINAPTGDYDYFCPIHPGMSGKLHVVGAGQPVSSQADIDSRSQQQFLADQQLALQAEQQYSTDRTTMDGNTVTHHVSVGVSAADNHVAIDEMLPRRISVNQGDQVEFKWRDSHEVHTVGFAQAVTQLPEPFVFDCGTRALNPPTPQGGGGFCFEPGDALPEAIGDPGNALSGAFLRSPQQIVDSGLLVGSGYGIQPSIQTWSVRTDSKTQSGTYQYWCSVHDFMHGTLQMGQ